MQKELPGWEIQMKMSPYPVRQRNPLPEKAENCRQSAVLVPIFGTKSKDFGIILTLRSNDLRHHRGQISFPGGKKEDGETIHSAALREALEEIGLMSETVEILGSLSPIYIPVSNNMIYPVVGFVSEINDLKIDKSEVEEVFSVEIEEFLKEENFRREEWKIGEKMYNVPFWNVHSVPLWGASAMILQEFLAIYEEWKHNN